MPSPPSPTAVTSVNGKRGDVKLSLSDIGADIVSPASVRGIRVGHGTADKDTAATAKDIPNLGANKITTGEFDPDRLGTEATHDGTKVLYDDGVWRVPTGGGASASAAVQKGDGTGGFADATAADVVDLFTGTPDGTQFLRDDGTLATPAGAASASALIQKGDGSGGFSSALLADLITLIGSTSQNFFLAGPTSGAGAALKRLIVLADLPTGYPYANLAGAPSLAAIATSGSATDLITGTVPIARVPTGATGSTVPFGNDTRFPASVTGFRLGAGAGSEDAAAALSDLITLIGSTTQNFFLAGPASGGAGSVLKRAIVGEDLATGTPTSTYFLISTGIGARPQWVPVSGANVGITNGKDRNRPAANSTTNFYGSTDTNQSYWTDQIVWRNTAAGPDKVTLDQASGGFSDTNYLASAAGVTSGPSFASSTSVAVLFKVLSLPGVGGGLIAGCGSGNFTAGWELGNSVANSNKLRLIMAGVNGTGSIEINATLTTGVHCLAFNQNGSQIRASLDGGAIVTAAISGTYVPPSAVSSVLIGRYIGAAGFSCPWMSFGGMQAHASLLSDADLQALGGNTANYLFGAITSDPSYDWQSRWVNLAGFASGVVAFPAYGSGTSKLSSITGQGSGIFKNSF